MLVQAVSHTLGEFQSWLEYTLGLAAFIIPLVYQSSQFSLLLESLCSSVPLPPSLATLSQPPSSRKEETN